MKFVRIEDQVVSPWKNGGGTTRSVAIHPEGAGLDDFDWRISVAEVSADGPFSSFPGVDRVLVLLEGHGMALTAPEGSAELTEVGASWAFPGEWAVQGKLLGGPTRDLNVMTRRGKVKATVALLSVETEVHLDGAVIVVDGQLMVDGLWLRSGEAVLGDGLHVVGLGRLVHVGFTAC